MRRPNIDRMWTTDERYRMVAYSGRHMLVAREIWEVFYENTAKMSDKYRITFTTAQIISARNYGILYEDGAYLRLRDSLTAEAAWVELLLLCS